MVVEYIPNVAFPEKCYTCEFAFRNTQVYAIYYVESQRIDITFKPKPIYRKDVSALSTRKLINKVKEAFYIKKDIPVNIVFGDEVHE